MARSLRAHLLRLLLPPIAALLAVGAVVAYYPSMEPATEAYNQALVDIGIALGSYVRTAERGYSFDLPPAVEQALRTDRYDTIYYRVVSPEGGNIAGDADLPLPPDSSGGSYDAQIKGQRVHVVSVQTPCGANTCNILVAETTVKRTRLTRDILFSSLMPQMLLAAATLVIVWFGVKRGLGPLARLSEEIKGRSPRDLHPIDAAGAPDETRPLLTALNGLLEQVAERQQRDQAMVHRRDER
jgi:two-component system sensor histidine kinase TctE